MFAARSGSTADVLFSMLLPFWQLAIGLVVLVFVVVASLRLARRGRSRMTTAVLVAGAAVVGINVLAVLLSGR